MKKNKLWLYLFGLLVLLFIIVASILLSREKQEQVELSFETIEMAEIPGTGYEYPGKEPALVIITKREDVASLGDIVSKQSQLILNSLNFSDYFVITVFQGIKGTTSYGVEIQRIFKKDNVITIYTHFTERDPSLSAGTLMTSPYHIVKIPRQGLFGQMEFILFADGEEIIHQTYNMP
jgi:hypothetical protein